jgi:hypothetical protein
MGDHLGTRVLAGWQAPWRGALRSKAVRPKPSAGTSGVTPPGPLNATDRPQLPPSVSIRHIWDSESQPREPTQASGC